MGNLILILFCNVVERGRGVPQTPRPSSRLSRWFPTPERERRGSLALSNELTILAKIDYFDTKNLGFL